MRFTMLEALSEEDRRRVLASTSRRRFDRRQILFHSEDPGDTMHLIEKGRVAVRITTEFGDEVMVDVLGVGDMVGMLAVLGEGRRRAATVVALEPTETLSITRAAFEALRRAQPSVDRFVIDALVADLLRTDQLLLEALYSSVESRVIRRLARLARIYGRGADPRLPVEIAVTQHDLATLAGTSRATANRVLRELEVAGVVTLTRNRIHVIDGAALTKRAN